MVKFDDHHLSEPYSLTHSRIRHTNFFFGNFLFDDDKRIEWFRLCYTVHIIWQIIAIVIKKLEKAVYIGNICVRNWNYFTFITIELHWESKMDKSWLFQPTFYINKNDNNFSVHVPMGRLFFLVHMSIRMTLEFVSIHWKALHWPIRKPIIYHPFVRRIFEICGNNEMDLAIFSYSLRALKRWKNAIILKPSIKCPIADFHTLRKSSELSISHDFMQGAHFQFSKV